jgi:acetyltransferase-like isoleucine patch superfamily enzyme
MILIFNYFYSKTMNFISGAWDGIVKILLLRLSHERRIKYLRRQGVKIGQNCRIQTMEFSTEPYLIEIGNNVRIAHGTLFITHDGAVNVFREELNGGIFGKINIGNNVFIGINSIVLLNTTIGNNCIIGAGSVVRGTFPDNSVIVGNPAKVIMNSNIQKMFYRQSPGLLKTNNLPKSECTKIIKEHFGIK